MILTPHVGGSTREAQRDIGVEVSRPPPAACPGLHRLLHIHRNQPGVLSEFNAIFSEHRINIAGQYLQTNARLGYAVIDIETRERTEAQALKENLDRVQGTIRTRILY